MTSPPCPPLPPSGPPRGLNFSRWTEATPSPPEPAETWSVTLSTKLGTATGRSFRVGPVRAAKWDEGAARSCGLPLQRECSLVLLRRDARDDVDDLAATTTS